MIDRSMRAIWAGWPASLALMACSSPDGANPRVSDASAFDMSAADAPSDDGAGATDAPSRDEAGPGAPDVAARDTQAEDVDRGDALDVVDVAADDVSEDAPPPADDAIDERAVDVGGLDVGPDPATDGGDLPTIDAPSADLPAIDMPSADLPTIDVPTIDVPTIDVPAAPVDAGCRTDDSCGPGYSCQSDGTCRARLCVPNVASCSDATTRQLCDADGMASAALPCLGGLGCADGVCVPSADGCPGVEIAVDGPTVTFPLSGLRPTLDSGMTCGFGPTHVDWVGHFHLSATTDVRVTATDEGGTAPAFQLRRGACDATAPAVGGCVGQTAGSYNYRGLEAGDYFVVAVAIRSVVYPNATGSFTVATVGAPPRVGDVCALPAEVTPDGAPVTIIPATFDAAAGTGSTCGATTGPTPLYDGVWHFRLDATRDVRLDAAGCTGSYQVFRGCGTGAAPVGDCPAPSTQYHRWHRALPAGDYSVVVGLGASPTACTLSVTTAAPDYRPPGDTCANPIELTPDGPAEGSRLDARYGSLPDLAWCAGSIGDAIWHFRLGTTRDVTLAVTDPANPMNRVPFEVRTACDRTAPQIGPCRFGAMGPFPWMPDPPTTIRALPPGDYYVALATSGGTSFAPSVRVSTADPGVRAPGDTCGTALTVVPDGPASSVRVGDVTYEGVSMTCAATAAAPDAFFAYTLTSTRDVRVAVSSDVASFGFEVSPRCGAHDVAGSQCRYGQGAANNLVLARQAPGTYYVAVSSSGTEGVLSTRVTTAPPGTIVSYREEPAEDEATAPTSCSGGTIYLRSGAPTSTLLALPFPFRFWGRDLPSGAPVRLSAWGQLVMDGGATVTPTGTLGRADAPNALISAVWNSALTLRRSA
ncbi:MAG: hypothetical protein JWM10_1353 [Myxococcaceae bacterium]|nr:hypothetical protein [Myxococcaceae bacterium]